MAEAPSSGTDFRVVIIGAGFGGLACAKELGVKKLGVKEPGGSTIHVTVIDRENYHLFVPLLYQVATAALSPADIARPIRRILGRYRNIEVVFGAVTGLDAQNRAVQLSDGRTVPFDRLVIATGSHYSYFGHPEWQRIAPGPRTLEQARRIRSSLLHAFEQAEAETVPAERDALMTIVIVGGGPTGVEMAGAVAELARHSLARDFRHIDPRDARIILVEAGPRLLSAFPKSLADFAHTALERLGVTVITGKAVEAIDADGVVVAGERIPARTMIWGAGVEASPAGHWLGIALDRAGRIPVAPDLSVPGWDGVFALGDTARNEGADGEPLPALAQVAAQQGDHLGRALAKNLLNGEAIPAFHFRNRGNTAIIGRDAAVFDFGRFQLKGRLAWLLWALVHVYLLVGFDNRLRVVVQWVWRYLTYESGARLIMWDTNPDK